MPISICYTLYLNVYKTTTVNVITARLEIENKEKTEGLFV